MNKHERRTHLWLSENPRAYQLFDKYASQLAATGKRFGAKLVFERLRFRYFLEPDADGFKLNNNYTAYIARIWAEKNPRYAHLIEFRSIKCVQK